jgi:hypothetical protein
MGAQTTTPAATLPRVQVPPADNATNSDTSNILNSLDAVPQVPGLSSELRGFNAGITFAGLHDSAVGWSTIATPALGYAINDIFSVDVSIPIYLYRLAESLSKRPLPDQRLVALRGEPGDTILSGHAQFTPGAFQYEATAALALPSGDKEYGLTSGRVTFDFDNHLERSLGHGGSHGQPRFAPFVDAGLGDSTTLANRLLTRNYTSLGLIAHFQAGMGVALPLGASFESAAYEQLPVGDQKTYSSVTRRGVTTLVVTGRNASEDNGFVNSLEIPLNDHTTLTSYYSRSLRLHDDIVSMSVTFVLRGLKPPPPPPRGDPLEQDIQKLFR